VRAKLLTALLKVMLIGLMFLPNGMVYTQFHPVAYMVKLNIEMTMASLIKKIALASISERDGVNPYHDYVVRDSSNSNNGRQTIESSNPSKVGNKLKGSVELVDYYINKKTVVNVTHGYLPSSDGESPANQSNPFCNGFDQRERNILKRQSDDEISLRP
jgi:hypothetical protein